MTDEDVSSFFREQTDACIGSAGARLAALGQKELSRSADLAAERQVRLAAEGLSSLSGAAGSGQRRPN